MQSFSIHHVARLVKYGLAPALRAPLVSAETRFLDQLRYQHWKYHDLKHQILVFPESKLVFVETPKAACTTIKALLFQMLNLPPAGNLSLSNTHRHYTQNAPGFALDDTGYYDALTSPDYYRFAFARHPFARLYSAYKDKIAPTHVRPDSDFFSEYVRIVKWATLSIGTPISFELFVTYVSQQNVMDMNRHWAPQTDVLFMDTLSYDFIGKVEQFAEDMAVVLEKNNAPASIFDQLTQRKNQSSSEDAWRGAYDSAMKEAIYQRYQNDFQCFGYPNE